MVGQGAATLRKALGNILEDAQNELTFSARELINDLWQQWQCLDNFIDKATKEIEHHARENSDCKLLMGIDGVGHIISLPEWSAVCSQLGTNAERAFKRW